MCFICLIDLRAKFLYPFMSKCSASLVRAIPNSVLLVITFFTLFMTGNKVNNVDVVYTPWSNLKKTASMDVGQVGFHNPKMVSVFTLGSFFTSFSVQ